MDPMDFETERPRLTAIAARILGSNDEADDVYQEAWLRLIRAVEAQHPAVGKLDVENHDIRNAPAWLTTVVTRLRLDHLRARRTRSAAETRAPAEAAAPDPETDALLAERVSEAMQLVLDALVPAERAAFVLHDVFGYPFDEIGGILGRSDTAVRQLASRARRKVRGTPETGSEQTDTLERQRVVDAFLTAARGGELSTLLALLAPDAVMRADHVGRRMGTDAVYAGADAVAARFNGSKGTAPVVIDGDPGAAWFVHGTVRVAFAFHVEGGVIREVELIADPDILATLEVRVRRLPRATVGTDAQ